MMAIGILNSRFLSLNRTIYIVIGSAIYQCLQISLMIYLGNQLNINGISLAVVLALSAQALVLTYVNIRLKNGRITKPKRQK